MRSTAFHEGRHLTEDLLAPPAGECPICGSHERTAVLAVQRAPLVELLACARCRAHSVSRMPTSEALDDYYSTYYETGREAAVTTDDPARLARRIASYCASTNRLRILDFGGGDGSVAVEIATAIVGNQGSADIIVVDYEQDRDVATPSSTVVTWQPSLEQVADRRFDLVLASAVLEHLPGPTPVLIDLLSRLTPGGIFYARTPYVAPLMRIAHRVHSSFDFTFPAHLHDLGQPFWDSLLDWLPTESLDFPVTQVGSRPSPLETSLASNPTRTIVAAVLKAPWHVLGSRYTLVGGWEAVYQADAGQRP